MGESQVGTRGEHQAFDPDRVREREHGWTFVCPTIEQLVLLLKRGKKTVINGEVIVEEDVVARFQTFQFHTDNEKVAELVRQNSDYKVGRVLELSKLREQAREKQIAATTQQLSDDPELLKAAVARLKAGKGAAPEVKQ